MAGSSARDPAPGGLGAGFWLVGATAIVSGVSTFVNSYAVGSTSSAAFVTSRNLLVALLLLPIAVLAVRRSARALPSGASEWGRLVLIGLIGGAIPFLLFFRGLQLATEAGGATTASFLYRTLFLWAIVLGVVALRERVSPWVLAGAVALLLGSYLMLSIRSPVWTDGSLYVLVATALWASEYTVSKHLMRSVPSMTVALGRMGFGAIFLVGYLVLTGGVVAAASFGAAQWLWVGISALLLTAFVALWYPGLSRLDLGVATSVLVAGYPVTFLLSELVRPTALAPSIVVGAVLVAGGAVLAAGPRVLRSAGLVARGAARSAVRSPDA